jgi:hypothetical protein
MQSRVRIANLTRKKFKAGVANEKFLLKGGIVCGFEGKVGIGTAFAVMWGR